MKKTTLLSLGFAAAATMTTTSQAAVILSTDFTGVTRTTTPIATTIAWTTSDLTLASNDLTIASVYGTGSPAIRTDNNANRIGVNYNVETGGGRSWNTTITFTTTSVLDLTNFNVDFHAISGGGADQISSTKNGDFTFRLFTGVGTGGTELFSGLEDNLVDSGGAGGVAEASYDLTGLADLAIGTYTLEIQVERGTETGGNNWAMDDIVFNAEAVPEPSSTALLGLGGLALILRRRK